MPQARVGLGSGCCQASSRRGGKRCCRPARATRPLGPHQVGRRCEGWQDKGWGQVLVRVCASEPAVHEQSLQCVTGFSVVTRRDRAFWDRALTGGEAWGGGARWGAGQGSGMHKGRCIPGAPALQQALIPDIHLIYACCLLF